MQGGKKAGESIKEKAANLGASAKAGFDKTKATVQEKTEKMTARDPVQKELATQKKEARMTQAELDKQAAREHNAAAKQSSTAGQMTGTGPGTATYSTTGEYGQPTGHVTEGAVGSHPIGTNRGPDGTATAPRWGKPE